jgi:DNA-binding NtrC family response regulator
MPRILIADDQADVLAALRLLLKGNRFEIETASYPAGVLEVVNSQELDVVLIDRQIAEAHGGTLTLENRRGLRGCEALLRLPL